MRYKIKLYNTYNSLSADYEFTDESELHEIQEIRQDGDKFIDDEFFSFEAKKLSLAFVPNESPCAIKLKEYIECSDFIVRNYPPTDDGYVAPSVSTSFINRRIEIWTKEDWDASFKLVFSGFPDVSSFSRNYKTNTYSIDLASVYYVFFDNIEELSELNIFNSYLMREYGEQCSNDFGYSFETVELLNDFIGFYRSNGIDLSAILSIRDAMVSAMWLNNISIYKDFEDFGCRAVYEETGLILSNFDEFKRTLDNYIEIQNPLITLKFISYVRTKNTIPIRIEYYRKNESFTEIDFVRTINKKVLFKGIKRFIVDSNSFSIMNQSLSAEFYQGDRIVDYIENQLEITDCSVNYHKTGGLLSEIVISIRHWYGNIWTETEADSFTTLISNSIDSVITSISNLTETPRTVSLNGLTFTIGSNYPSILVEGSYLSKVRLYSKFDNTLNLYTIRTEATNGVFNPDSFSAKDFLKIMLILSGKYMIHSYSSNVSDINISQNFNIPSYVPESSEPQFPSESDIIDFSCKKTFINLNKTFSEMDFSETDHHFLIRGLLYYFKQRAGSLQSVFNLSILKTQSYLNAYSVGNTMRAVSGERYYINSIEIEEDLMNLEIILLTTLLQ